MNRRTALRTLGALGLVSCSRDVVGPGNPAPPIATSKSTYVTSPGNIREAILDGCYDLYFTKSLYFYPGDEINVSQLVPANTHKTTSFALRGPGGLFIAEIGRAEPGTTPLIKFEADRDWDFRFSGLVFNLYARRGPALWVGYAQQSMITDVHFQDSNGLPAYFGTLIGSRVDYMQSWWCSDDMAVPATERSDADKGDVLMENVSCTEFRNAMAQTIWGRGEQGRGGYTLRAQPHNPPYTYGGGLWWYNPQISGCKCRFENFKQAVVWEGGEYISAEVDWTNCVRSEVEISQRGLIWTSSTMRWDGRVIL